MGELGYTPDNEVYDDETSVVGCGLCQTKVPCENRIPAKLEKKSGAIRLSSL
jgi:hypothetical protein